MRLTDRLLAAIYRALRNAENREWKQRHRLETESVSGQLTDLARMVYSQSPPPPPPAPPDSVQMSREVKF